MANLRLAVLSEDYHLMALMTALGTTGGTITKGLWGPVTEETTGVFGHSTLQHCNARASQLGKVRVQVPSFNPFAAQSIHAWWPKRRDTAPSGACIITVGHQRRTSCKRLSARQPAAAPSQIPPDTVPMSPEQSRADSSSQRIFLSS